MLLSFTADGRTARIHGKIRQLGRQGNKLRFLVDVLNVVSHVFKRTRIGRSPVVILANGPTHVH